MSIQEISLANNQKKRLLKAVKDRAVLFADENGELVVNVANYEALKKELIVARSIKPNLELTPIEAIVGEGVLDFSSEYFVFI